MLREAALFHDEPAPSSMRTETQLSGTSLLVSFIISFEELGSTRQCPLSSVSYSSELENLGRRWLETPVCQWVRSTGSSLVPVTSVGRWGRGSLRGLRPQPVGLPGVDHPGLPSGVPGALTEEGNPQGQWRRQEGARLGAGLTAVAGSRDHGAVPGAQVVTAPSQQPAGGRTPAPHHTRQTQP